MNFKEYLNEFYIIESKTLVGVKITCEAKVGISNIFAEENANKYNAFGTKINIVDTIIKYNKNKDVHTHTLLIKMEDTSIIDKNFLSNKLPDIVRDVFKLNFISSSFKASKLMEDTSLDNISVGSVEEKIYKKIFSKAPVNVGKKMNVPNHKHGIYRVINLISNEMMLVEYSFGPFSRNSDPRLYVKDEGVYWQSQSPKEYLKYF